MAAAVQADDHDMITIIRALMTELAMDTALALSVVCSILSVFMVRCTHHFQRKCTHFTQV